MAETGVGVMDVAEVSRDTQFPALGSRDGCNSCGERFGWRHPV
jgi:hypothetical protein